MDTCCAHVLSIVCLAICVTPSLAAEDSVTERLLLGCEAFAVHWRLWATGLWLAFVRLPPWRLSTCVGACVPVLSPTSVSFGLSVIVTSALRWATGLLHIQPLECVGDSFSRSTAPSVLARISSSEPFRWHPSYTPAHFLSRQTPCFLGLPDIATKIITLKGI
jgi:hypothetical protein